MVIRPVFVTLLSAVALRLALVPHAPAVPHYTLAEEWRISASSENVKDVGIVTIAPNGLVIVAPNAMAAGEIIAFDSTGTSVRWRLPVGWRNSNDVRVVSRDGFTGSTFWVADRGYEQVALLDAKGTVAKSLAYPAFVRPSLSERHKYPVFGGLDVFAVYADGSWLVRPRDAHSLVDTPGYDTTQTHLYRVAESGVIDRPVATFPADPVIDLHEGNRHIRIPAYFPNRVMWGVSQDGMRVATVVASMTGKDSATYRVTMINERGDTVFEKRFPYTPELIAKTSRDSALVHAGNVNNGGFANLRAEIEKRIPPFYNPVYGVLVGRDRTTWITLRPPPGDSLSLTRLVLDPHGDPVATVTTRAVVAILAADREHVWAVERVRGAQIAAVVRYKLVPTR